MGYANYYANKLTGPKSGKQGPSGPSPGDCDFVSKMNVSIPLKGHTHVMGWQTAHSNQPTIIVSGLDWATIIKHVNKGHL